MRQLTDLSKIFITDKPFVCLSINLKVSSCGEYCSSKELLKCCGLFFSFINSVNSAYNPPGHCNNSDLNGRFVVSKPDSQKRVICLLAVLVGSCVGVIFPFKPHVKGKPITE